jgi:hypothetical protein
VRTIQFSVQDDTYAAITDLAIDLGIGGHYAASILARMVTCQMVGTSLGRRGAILVPVNIEEQQKIRQYVFLKKGYVGPNPEGAFLLKAGFDIMSKYPAKVKKE